MYDSDDFEKLDLRTENIAREIVDSAIRVHKQMGPGLLESIYETCMTHELKSKGFVVERQKQISLKYGNIVLEEYLRLDMLIEGKIIIEIKSAEKSHAVWKAQLLSYLKLTDNRLGFLLNFNVPLMKHGIRRFIK
ncbi:GxxExxY protein [Spirosomataceae bacterium TFI 002]|nr:GxxExxY protein [Spirosomataceae bacterium TFI 002]